MKAEEKFPTLSVIFSTLNPSDFTFFSAKIVAQKIKKPSQRQTNFITNKSSGKESTKKYFKRKVIVLCNIFYDKNDFGVVGTQ